MRSTSSDRDRRVPVRTYLFLLVLIVCSSSLSFGETGQAPVLAPLNPEFEQYLDRTVPLVTQTKDGRALGLVPAPLKLPNAAAPKVVGAQLAASLPTRYDLREHGRLTPIRDQMACGSCWTFATYGAMESLLLPGEQMDFSENHLKNAHGFNFSCCDGGNHFISTAYLARWDGPVAESDDPYNGGSCESPTGLPVRKHVQDVDFLPNRTGPLDNAVIKQAVMTYGAVHTAIFYDDMFYNEQTHGYSFPGGWSTNHAVCIVGWDDSYSRSNFIYEPPGDGAFIVRNSWGTSWGEGGYFYVSYYDAKLVDNVIFRISGADSYDKVYQYDPFGWVRSLGHYWETTAWFANVFTAGPNERLAAASWYEPVPNATYELSVYLNPGTDITGGTLVYKKSGTIATMGYHTVPLDASIPLPAGQRFAVVVKNTTPDYLYPVPFELMYQGYSGGASANPGESYVSYEGTEWFDLTTYYPDGNVCLKAFTFQGPRLGVTPSEGLSSSGLTGGPFTAASRTYTLSNRDVVPVDWTASAVQPWISLSQTSGTLPVGGSTTVTASINSLVEYLGPGVHTDEIAFTSLADGVVTTRPAQVTAVPAFEQRSSTYAWIEPAGHTPLTLTDNGVSAAQAIPFAFSFYGKTYNQVYVGANGLLGFVNSGLDAAVNTDIPTTAVPNASLYPYWDDLNPAAGGQVLIGTTGTAPDRRLVVSWVGIPHKDSPSTKFTFQAILCEGTNDIIFQYQQVQPAIMTYGAGRSATVGVESDGGTYASKYSFDGSQLLANGQALLFTNYSHTSIPSAKRPANGSLVALDDLIVSAVISSTTFWVESPDRHSGIQVVKLSHGLVAGDKVDIVGMTNTNSTGEKFVEGLRVAKTGTGTIKPLAMTNRTIGGSAFEYEPVTGMGQGGVKERHYEMVNGQPILVPRDAPGLNNIGLLVNTTGRVSYSGVGYFYVDDGSCIWDNQGYPGVKIHCPGLTSPAKDKIVKVTGISRCSKIGTDLYRLVRVRSQSDIVVMQ